MAADHILKRACFIFSLHLALRGLPNASLRWDLQQSPILYWEIKSSISLSSTLIIVFFFHSGSSLENSEFHLSRPHCWLWAYRLTCIVECCASDWFGDWDRHRPHWCAQQIRDYKWSWMVCRSHWHWAWVFMFHQIKRCMIHANSLYLSCSQLRKPSSRLFQDSSLLCFSFLVSCLCWVPRFTAS